jgi:hypothetical protein
MRSLAVLTLLGALAACEQNRPPHDCSGAAVDVVLQTPVDAGVDGGFTTADGGRAPKPACSADCREYRAALAAGVNANVPSVRCTSFGSTVVECLPASASDGCPSNTADSARAIEPAIANYLNAEWPELNADAGRLAIDPCPCRIY